MVWTLRHFVVLLCGKTKCVFIKIVLLISIIRITQLPEQVLTHRVVNPLLVNPKTGACAPCIVRQLSKQIGSKRMIQSGVRVVLSRPGLALSLSHSSWAKLSPNWLMLA